MTCTKTHHCFINNSETINFTGEGKWEYEVGEDSTLSPPTSSGLIVAASLNPVFVSRDSKIFFEWRIRNIPYPIETYELSVDDEKQQIVLRTTNKKLVPLMFLM